MHVRPEQPIGTAPRAFPLSEASVGAQLRIHSVAGNPCESHRLHEMGFCRRAELVKLCHGAMTVCLVCGARVGLSASVAQRILVTASPDESGKEEGPSEVGSLRSFSGEGTFFCRILDRFRRNKGGRAG
ncbi:Fe2+ transport system protein A (modular protein) [Methylacidimicrobium sp. AP8]|uniref:FeoA family protein n=1 Tax=Methylacidimicrobium sp. AP8 TaxID=2730359 RepID=UPI0018C0A3E0|nr:FeoA family protein [Methylacidimicrobium sp. AP8]CAB4243015.1 Fe2+ transport system protein A (modular protein) [Methylacidimicrobium sp. AP8]